ncbi:MAG: hypothetical protein RR998_07125 [Oscillospiraceae bacterium]
MKKTLAMLLTAGLALAALSGCSANPPADPAPGSEPQNNMSTSDIGLAMLTPPLGESSRNIACDDNAAFMIDPFSATVVKYDFATLKKTRLDGSSLDNTGNTATGTLEGVYSQVDLVTFKDTILAFTTVGDEQHHTAVVIELAKDGAQQNVHTLPEGYQYGYQFSVAADQDDNIYFLLGGPSGGTIGCLNLNSGNFQSMGSVKAADQMRLCGVIGDMLVLSRGTPYFITAPGMKENSNLEPQTFSLFSLKTGTESPIEWTQPSDKGICLFSNGRIIYLDYTNKKGAVRDVLSSKETVLQTSDDMWTHSGGISFVGNTMFCPCYGDAPYTLAFNLVDGSCTKLEISLFSDPPSPIIPIADCGDAYFIYVGFTEIEHLFHGPGGDDYMATSAIEHYAMLAKKDIENGNPNFMQFEGNEITNALKGIK